MKKGVRVVKETIKKQVGFLSDVDPEFVSLVKHAANRIPFKVIKKEKVGENNLVVQSILIPNGVNFDDVCSIKGLEWLADANKEEMVKFEEYSKFVQFPIEKFEKNSLGLAKLDESGVWAVVGKAEKEGGLENALTLGKREVDKFMSFPQNGGDAVIAEVPLEPAPITFNQMFDKELIGFIDVVKGSLSQSNVDASKRKKAVMGALDGFKNFLSMALDAVGNSAMNKNEKEFSVKMEEVTNVLNNTEGRQKMELFKDEKDFTEKVANIVASVLDQREKAEADSQAAQAEKAEAEKAKSEINTISETLKTLGDQVKAIAEKQEDLGNKVIVDPAGNKEVVDKKETKETVDPNVSPFKGMLKGIVY